MSSFLLLLACSPAPPQALWVFAPEAEQRRALAQERVGFLEAQDGDWLLIEADARGLARLQALGLRTRPAPPPAPPSEAYHDAEELEAALLALEQSHPDRAQLQHIGWSREGRPLSALRLGPADQPGWRIVGGHHGNEPISVELSLSLAQAMLEEQAPFEGLLDQSTVWVIPLANPDGLALDSRYNAAGVDLNRNYSFRWSEDSYGAGEAPFSEPETRALRDFALRESPHAGLALHAGAENIGWVYNSSSTDTLDEALLRAMAFGYAAQCALPGFEALNGADWYITYGDANDWSYGMQGTLDFTVELSTVKAPDAEQLPALLDAHLPAAASLLSLPLAVSGQVLDARSGRPVPATLSLEGQSGPFVAHPVSGRFARLLDQSPARLTVSAPGYASQTVDAGLDLELRLSPTGPTGLRLSPGLVHQDDGPLWLHVEGLNEVPFTATLRREGQDPVLLLRKGQRYRLDPEQLSAGAWTLDLGAEGALPRALLVSDNQRLGWEGVVDDGAQLTVLAQGLEPGARLYGLWGQDRAWQPLNLLSQGESSLIVDASALREAEAAGSLSEGPGTPALVLVSGGEVLAVALSFDPESTDSPAPEDPDSRAQDSVGVKLPHTPRACQTSSPLGWGALAGALFFAWRRRWPTPDSR